ncbi:glycogen synthase GlgA [Liberiplasma polymorphum]|uniref:glycogen synthase GlgA n=1 Tax=Liberiplasma polymorphum TaxID=3374570 RepID=UPI003770C23D
MRIMFIGSEATPFIKTGGLADVLGSLPKTLASLGHEVSLVLPLHRKIKEKFKDDLTFVRDFRVGIHTKDEYVGIETIKADNVTVYFIDNEYYFGYRENLYGDFDDGERYGYYNQAVLKMLHEINYFPDVLHLNDWQSGLIPYILKQNYNDDERYTKLKTIFTIHNIAYQGVFSKTLLPYLNVPYHTDIEYDGQINFLKTAIVNADYITTVSKTYAEEIMYDYFGFGMSRLLTERKHKLTGIMNGIDLDDFDPKKDKLIHKNFGLNNYVSGKNENKQALLKMFHLQDLKLPVIGMVSRLTEAKGFPLVEAVIENLLKEKRIQFILLGSGDHDIETFYNHLKQKYPKHVGVYFGYSDTIARQIYAGSNFFLMPSRFEPCGLAQLISMRYGTLPIVRETGGLKDSVLPFNKYTHDGTGFSFTNYNAHEMLEVIEIAIKVYKDQKTYKKLVKRVMNEDFSWQKSAATYVKLYEKVLEE